MIFFRNELVRLVDENQLMRVLWISPSADAMVVMRVDGGISVPQWVQRSDWEALSQDGKIEPVADDERVRLPVENGLDDKARARRDNAWKHVQSLVEAEPDIYLSDKRAAMIRTVSETAGAHKDTIRNWLFEYWQRGMTKNALLPYWDKCGNRDKRKTAGEAKRGRPRTVSPGTGMNVCEKIREIFEVAISNYFLRNKKAGIKHTYNTMLRKFFSDRVEEGERGKLILRDVDSIPTYEAFYYWYRISRNEQQEARARKGRAFYERTMRPLLGNSTDEAIGPGYRYQIDATIADVYLASKVDLLRIIGRPVIYVVIDVWSRLIVGIYVGLERPSWTAAIMALLNAASDKVEFCKQYGIEIEAEEWPVSSLSSVVLGDRGEMESALATRMSEVLGVDVENTPPYRADWKGIVERRFNTLQAKFKPFVDGYIDVDYQERGGEDYRLDAKLTLDDFNRIMINAVLDHNATPIRGYPLLPAMIREGVLESPNEIWKWGVKNRSGMLKRYKRDLLQFALMHTAEAKVTASGFEFYGRNYMSGDVTERNWFSKARNGTWRVRVSYDPRCLDEILLHDAHERRRFKALRLIAEDSEEFGLSLQEVLAKRKQANSNRAAHKHPALQRTLEAEQAIEDIVSEARKRMEALGADNRSKAERTSEIRPNAEVERRARQKEEKFTTKPDEVNAPPVPGNVVRLRSVKQNLFAIPTIFDLQKKQ